MDKYKYFNEDKKNIEPFFFNNHQGFSLLELLVSIAILVVVMVPLMNYFIRSARFNHEAERVQSQTDLAANLMEGLKATEMEDIIAQFTGVEEDFTIISGLSQAGDYDLDGDLDYPVMRLQETSNPITSEREYQIYNTLDKDKTYYFTIHGAKEGKRIYDVLITMNSQDYLERSDTMNDYPMPKLINLDKNANSLLFSHGKSMNDETDVRTLNLIRERGKAYAKKLFEQSEEYLNYLAALEAWRNDSKVKRMKGETPDPSPTPVTFNENDYPEYCDLDTLKSMIIKTMKISTSSIMQQSTVGSGEVLEKEVTKVTYCLDYQVRNWPADAADIALATIPVLEIDYPKNIENIYLFYLPSIFQTKCLPEDYSKKQDHIIIENNSDHPINFFLARQDGGLIENPYIKISERTSSASVRTFTNLEDGYIEQVLLYPTEEDLSYEIVDSKEQNRIYSVTIGIYRYEDGELSQKYQKLLHTIESTKEDFKSN